MKKEKKMPVYWLGLIIVGLSVWALFVVLWIVMSVLQSPYRPIRIRNFSAPTILIVGAIIFSFIGLYMMKEGREA